MLLCYQLSDDNAQCLHQVQAPKAFQGGVPLDQIMLVCHWKSLNIFTQFYVKDVAWADLELYLLWLVVAAQQICE